MAKPLRRVVVDTCALLHLFVSVDEDMVRRVRAIIDDHGIDHTVVLPAIVVAEIGGAGEVRGSHLPALVRQQRLDAVENWLAGSRFMIADLSERLARQAARLAGRHQLKGADAAVLATAIEFGCSTLYTLDNDLLKLDSDFEGLQICEPDEPRTLV